jgi:hypothetical protein
MFTRVTAFVLALAVIACPLWCVGGLCHDSCCPAKQTTSVYCKKGCCEQPAHSKGQLPAAPVDDSNCQGICGGAVFEKPVEVNVDTFCQFLPPAIVEAPIAWASSLHASEDPWHICASPGNHGRYLRALHASLLC